MATQTITSDAEKAAYDTSIIDAHPGYEELGSEIQVLVDGSRSNLKTTPDGKIILIPQPSDHADDPLNWSPRKKITVLLSLLLPAFLADFSVTYGAAVFPQQAATWDMTVPAVANSLSGAIFMTGVGGLIAVPLGQRFGRLPTLFWSQLLACALVVGATLSPSYGGYTAARTLQGMVGSPPQVLGLAVIHDMFFFHERTRKIGFWVWAVQLGPNMGPFMSSLLVSRITWRQDFGVLAALYGLSTIIVFVFGAETLYDRKNPAPRPKGITGRLAVLTGWAGYRVKGRPSMTAVCVHILQMQVKPQIFVIISTFYMLLFMWGIGIVSTVAEFLYPPPYLFTPVQVGLFYLAPAIGTVIGELWGHFFNDFIANLYIRKHSGVFAPEARLWGCYVPVLCAFAGLILFGQSLQHQLPWPALAIAWLIYVLAQVSATVAVSAYCLDSFPRHSTVVSAIINFWRTLGGFCVTYFQVLWVERNGSATSFGVQAGILAASFVAVVVVQVYGKRWRARYPPPMKEV